MEIVYKADNEAAQQTPELRISVCGNHSWAAESPSFFIPAAGIAVGRIISIFSSMVRRALHRAVQALRNRRRRNVHFVLPGNSNCGRLISRRL